LAYQLRQGWTTLVVFGALAVACLAFEIVYRRACPSSEEKPPVRS
jgi:hypothetical protein